MGRSAVVVGSGPNGLAAAVVLARAGLDVVVHEAEERIGGGTRTEELTLPGFHHDLCSAIHPLARSSSVFRELGIEWLESPACLAHPLDDEEAILLVRDVDETAAGLGDDSYRRLAGGIANRWRGAEPWHLVRALRWHGLAPAARFFRTRRARALMAGCAAHSFLPLERRLSGGVGLTLLALGHVCGWPFPRGGSQMLADALAAAARDAGAEIRTSSPVDELPRADVVLCDVSPRELERISGARMPRVRYGPGAFKLDWALAGPIPWRDPRCLEASTVHLGGTFEEVAAAEAAVWRDEHPARPFVLLCQQSQFDPSRAPPGQHTGYAYCHVPAGSSVDLTAEVEAQVERFAPGFRDLVLARHVTKTADLARENPNYLGGAITGGVADLFQLFTRPVARVDPYSTPNPRVFLCSASTPPGGGVHGMCGYHAARSAARRLERLRVAPLG